MRNLFCSIAIVTTFLCSSVILPGCGTSGPAVDPAQALPPSYADSISVPSLKQFDWANYQLGHWEYDRGIGWTWVPGYVWSPSQVVWFAGYEYLNTASIPPPEIVLPRPKEMRSAVQGSLGHQNRNAPGGFDETNLRAILDKIHTHRVVATTREILRANLALDFPLTLFTFDGMPPPGPPPVPRFVFEIP